MEPCRPLYLDLMKRALTNAIYPEAEAYAVTPRGFLLRAVARVLVRHGFRLLLEGPRNTKAVRTGWGWPTYAHTMIGLKRLDNLQFCVESVLAENVPGDVIEAGVWRGGACIFMRAVLKAYDARDRVVWCADSFAGAPPPDPAKYPADAGDRHHLRRELAVSLEQVKANFQRYGLLDEQVRFLEGRFRDILPNAPVKRLAVLRLDGDLYESTWDSLTHLYPRLSPAGYVIVDDYGAVESCRRAVCDFRRERGIEEEIMQIDWSAVYWRRSS
jgi:O-methyltransferase